MKQINIYLLDITPGYITRIDIAGKRNIINKKSNENQ